MDDPKIGQQYYVLTGPKAVGKTTAVCLAAEEHRNVIYVKVGNRLNSFKQGLQLVMQTRYESTEDAMLSFIQYLKEAASQSSQMILILMMRLPSP